MVYLYTLWLEVLALSEVAHTDGTDERADCFVDSAIREDYRSGLLSIEWLDFASTCSDTTTTATSNKGQLSPPNNMYPTTGEFIPDAAHSGLTDIHHGTTTSPDDAPVRRGKGYITMGILHLYRDRKEISCLAANPAFEKTGESSRGDRLRRGVSSTHHGTASIADQDTSDMKKITCSSPLTNPSADYENAVAPEIEMTSVTRSITFGTTGIVTKVAVDSGTTKLQSPEKVEHSQSQVPLAQGYQAPSGIEKRVYDDDDINPRQLASAMHGGTVLVVMGIPSYMTIQDLLSFIGAMRDSITHVRIIRDAVPSRYMAVVKLANPESAIIFYRTYNAKPFNSFHDDNCYLGFVRELVFTSSSFPAYSLPACFDDASALFFQKPSAPLARPTSGKNDGRNDKSDRNSVDGDGKRDSNRRSVDGDVKKDSSKKNSEKDDQKTPTPPPTLLEEAAPTSLDVTDRVELPTCPVCLERLDAPTSGLVLTSLCHHSFHGDCLSKWQESTTCPVCRYSHGGDAAANTASITVCASCNPPCVEDLWLCLICGHVGCGRYRNKHAYAHFVSTSHCFAIEAHSGRVWDYVKDGYVHRLIVNKTDGKIVEIERGGLRQNMGTPGVRPARDNSANEASSRLQIQDLCTTMGSPDCTNHELESTKLVIPDPERATLVHNDDSQSWRQGGPPHGLGGGKSKWTFEGGDTDERASNTTSAFVKGRSFTIADVHFGHMRDNGRGASASFAEPEREDDFPLGKLEALSLEYTMLLTSQLDSQRVYFETQLSSLRDHLSEQSSTMASRILELEGDNVRLKNELEIHSRDRATLDKKYTHLHSQYAALLKEHNETNALYSALRINFDVIKKKLTEKENECMNLEEQCRDLMFFVDARDKIENSPMKSEITEGRVEVAAAAKKKGKGKLRRG